MMILDQWEELRECNSIDRGSSIGRVSVSVTPHFTIELSNQ